MYDVVVVGAGPAGSRTALRLAGAGFRVAVIERRERLGGSVCCTGIIGRACLEALGLGDGLVLKELRGVSLFSPSGRCLRLGRPEAQAYLIDRAALDAVLAARAQDAGAEYLLGRQVESIAVGDSGAGVVASNGSGRLEVAARAVVIAAGFGSSLTACLGLGRVADLAIGAQAEVASSGLSEMEVYCGADVAPGFFAWAVPRTPSRALVGLLSRRGTGLYFRRFLAWLREQGKIVSEEVLPRYRGVSLRPLAKTHGDRLVVVGDAAGQVKPTTGGGIYYGLLCADIAADYLIRALRSDKLSARDMAGYEREWRRRLGRELRFGGYARRLYERLDDGQLDRLFDITEHSGLDKTLWNRPDLSFDWHGEMVWGLAKGLVSEAIGAVGLPFSYSVRGHRNGG